MHKYTCCACTVPCHLQFDDAFVGVPPVHPMLCPFPTGANKKVEWKEDTVNMIEDFEDGGLD